MKILKRNQIIISVRALMLITVGYMNYTSGITATLETGALMDAEQMAGIGDAKLVNSNSVVEEPIEDNAEENNTTIESSINNETLESSINSNTSETSANIYEAEYFVSSRLERDKMYSEMIETYKEILESSVASGEQKTMSTEQITNINNKKNSIMIAENLIKNLGFENVVIFVNEGSVSVIIKAENLEQAQIAQIQNIVCREIGVEADLIHISLK